MLARIMIMLFLGVTLLSPLTVFAQRHGPGWYEGMPYGRSCPGYRWGPYGAKQTIGTADEAKQAIEKYYARSNQSVQVAIIAERRWFYVAEITDPDGTLVDKLIIDKRSGRIRSIY